jgi:hypothetical protein
MAHGMSPMIRNLRREPPMDCHDKGGIRSGIKNLSSVRQRLVPNDNLPEPGPQFGQFRHVIAVNPGRVGKVTPTKLFCFLLQVALNQPDLPFIGGILGGYRLPPAVIEPLKDVNRPIEIEWHHLCAANCDLGLAAASRQGPEAKDNPEDDH